MANSFDLDLSEIAHVGAQEARDLDPERVGLRSENGTDVLAADRSVASGLDGGHACAAPTVHAGAFTRCGGLSR